MKLVQPCAVCGTKESHGYRVRYESGQRVLVCARCANLSLGSSYQQMPAHKSSRQFYAKDLVQPYRYKKRSGWEINPDFKRVYPTQAKRIQQSTKIKVPFQPKPDIRAAGERAARKLGG